MALSLSDTDVVDGLTVFIGVVGMIGAYAAHRSANRSVPADDSVRSRATARNRRIIQRMLFIACLGIAVQGVVISYVRTSDTLTTGTAMTALIRLLTGMVISGIPIYCYHEYSHLRDVEEQEQHSKKREQQYFRTQQYMQQINSPREEEDDHANEA